MKGHYQYKTAVSVAAVIVSSLSRASAFIPAPSYFLQAADSTGRYRSLSNTIGRRQPVSIFSTATTEKETANGLLDQTDKLDHSTSTAVTSISGKDEKFGSRGELFVAAQGVLILSIVLGGLPFINNDVLSMGIGSSLILIGLITMFLSGKELGGSLSHWAIPVEKSEGGEGLVSSGVYSQVRHPMYTGLLSAMAGLAVATNSAPRLALTLALFYILNNKAVHEEKSLEDLYPEYGEYKNTVKGKIIPHDFLA